jgi:hypothetical protein
MVFSSYWSIVYHILADNWSVKGSDLNLYKLIYVTNSDITHNTFIKLNAKLEYDAILWEISEV